MIAAVPQASINYEEIFNFEPPEGYWQRQESKGVFPYVDGMLAKWLPPPAKILEIGCDAGRVSLGLQARGYQMTGLDIVQSALDYARHRNQERNLKAKFVHGNALDLKFSDNEFDGVLLIRQFLSLFHGEDQRLQVLREAKRVCKPNGKIIVSIQNQPFQYNIWKFFYYIYERLFIYPFPKISRQKIHEIILRFKRINQLHQYLDKHPEEKQRGDIFIQTRISETMRNGIPFHMYSLEEIRHDLHACGLEILDMRDYVEFERKVSIPRFLRQGSPFLVFATQPLSFR